MEQAMQGRIAGAQVTQKSLVLLVVVSLCRFVV